MVGVEQNCDVDTHLSGNGTVSPSVVNSQNGSQQNSTVNLTAEPNLKRARLGSDISQGVVNGLATSNSDRLANGGWPFRPDLMQLFRSTFDNRLKDSLKHNLSSYITRLTTTENKMASMKTEFKEISERMDCIEKSSKDLKQVILDKVSLPTPTAGVGQRRTLSSQAPRIPPVTTAATTTNNEKPSTLPSVNFPFPLKVANTVLPVTIPSPSVTMTSQPPISSVPFSTPVLQAIRPLAPPIAAVPNISVQKPPLTRAPLSVRPLDMIDLTSEGSPTVDEVIPEPKKNVENVAVPNKTVGPITTFSAHIPTPPSAPRPFTNHNPIVTAPRITPNNSVVADANMAATLPGVGKNSCLPLFSPRQMSFRELQQLPVAPLPPIPFQTPLPTPVQPMPQLTIAEAAEGVCLQWNVAQQAIYFEQATAYEIYSYASSEVTLETICTCLPWKKVGDVAALPLPMACTLTHVQPNNLYYFIVRSVDRFRRYSAWSNVVNAYVG